jgi:hypothetical protein
MMVKGTRYKAAGSLSGDPAGTQRVVLSFYLSYRMSKVGQKFQINLPLLKYKRTFLAQKVRNLSYMRDKKRKFEFRFLLQVKPWLS